MNMLVSSGAMSANVADLFAAYVAAQEELDNVTQDREVEVPIKDRNNPGQFKGKYKYRYATLPGTLNHLRPILPKHGLWYSQFTQDGNMVTRIMHRSGQWMDTGHVPMPDIKGSPQDIGAIISFFKRYSLAEAFALAAEDDNDGNVESEVSFRARGAPRRTAEDERHEDEPPMGWGDWTRGFVETIRTRATLDELDELKERNKRLINGAKRHDASMYEDIGAAFAARRSVLDKNAPV